MPQGVLPFKYEEEKKSSGMTALAGLPLYLDLLRAMGLAKAADRLIGLRAGRQGWTDGQNLTTLLMLNLAGGECVEDLKTLQADDGFCRIMEACQTHGLPRQQRRKLQRRWRKKRIRTLPSSSSIFRYLNGFHDSAWDEKQVYGSAWIPHDLGPLAGFSRLNAEMLAFVKRNKKSKRATLDMDATIVETHKQEALRCYKKHKAYQPLNVWWAEQEMFVHTEFRAGNVPAGFEQKRVLEEALAILPNDVNRVRLRSDTAGYQHELLRYCELAENERFGRIEFAIGCDVSKEFKQAVAEVPESQWRPLHRIIDGRREETGREWAEVVFVSAEAGNSKKTPVYRYLATRSPLEEQAALPGVEVVENYPFPSLQLSRGKFKIHGLVSNMDWAGGDLIRWLYERCGKSEQAHTGLKSDLAGGKLPSGKFGANAAWWWIAVLAFNLNAALKRLALGEEWLPKRMKAVRFGLINLAGRVIRRSRQWIIRLGKGVPGFSTLLEARRRIGELNPAPT